MFFEVEKLMAITPSFRWVAGNLYLSEGTPVMTMSEDRNASSRVKSVSEIYIK
jgi:hypothetical protein